MVHLASCRWHPAAAGAVVAGVLLPLATWASPAAADEHDRVADGGWTGHLIYSASVLFPGDVNATGAADGAFDFVMSGGIVTEGSFTFSASGSGTVPPSGSATLAISGVGGVEGDASEVVLRGDSMSVTGVASAEGFEVPVDFTLSGAELTPLPLELWTATCDQLTGTFVQPIAEAVAAAGGSGTFDGYFVANRTAAGVDDATWQAYDQVVADADSIKQSVAAGGGIDPILLLDVLDRAEQLAASLPVNVECQNVQADLAPTFALSISAVIRDMIEAVIAAPDGLPLAALQYAVLAGIRSGVLSAASPPGSAGEQLSIQLEAIFQGRLTAAVGPPVDTDDVQQILLTAQQMGWTGTISAAQAAL